MTLATSAYFTRDEMTAAWLAIRPPGCDMDLDTAVLERPVMAILIRCKALATRREQQGLLRRSTVAQGFRLARPWPPASPHAAHPRPAARRPRRPDAKQRAANDLDLFQESTT